jgi:acyl-CoA thioester hydrolase
MPASFELNRIVTSADIDDLNHVNNAVYVNWMDDIAYKHWADLTKDYPLPAYVWVVLRHEIDYVGQATLNDEITIKTWIGETKGFKSERYIAFYKKDVLLVKSKTIWGMLDAETYKPTRIRENVLKVLQPFK